MALCYSTSLEGRKESSPALSGPRSCITAPPAEAPAEPPPPPPQCPPTPPPVIPPRPPHKHGKHPPVGADEPSIARDHPCHKKAGIPHKDRTDNNMYDDPAHADNQMDKDGNLRKAETILTFLAATQYKAGLPQLHKEAMHSADARK